MLCFNLNCDETIKTGTETFDACLNRTCGKFMNEEDMCLHGTLQMAQGSLSPDLYEKFIEVYNELIERRKLHLKKIDQ